MAIDSNAFTLSEWAMQSNSPAVQKITYSIYGTNSVLKDIPFTKSDQFKQVGVRWQTNLPTVSWGRLNQAPVYTKGKPSPYEETAYLIRNLFQVDDRFMKNPNAIESPIKTQIDAYLRAVSYELNNKFINNDPSNPSGDPDAWVGLKARLNTAGQSEYGTNSEMLINGGGLDLTMSTMTALIANQLLELFQRALDYMDAPDGAGVVAYMNDDMKRRLEFALRTMGTGTGFDVTQDNYDRSVETYKMCKIRDIGRTAPTLAVPNQTTRIITSTENSTGTADTGSTYSSIMFVKYGEGNFKGWMSDDLTVEPLGLDPTNGIMHNFVVDWMAGLWQSHTRSIARIYGLKMS